MKKLVALIVFLLITCHLSLITFVYARTTPQDILNSQLENYNSKVKTYSPQSKQTLENYSQKIAELNKKVTTDWEQNCLRQGEILEEYIKRNGVEEKKQTDGKTRNLTNEIENARYYLTYAHEAVAYQAAKKYVLNLTSEKNINSDINTQINILSGDLNILRGKVSKSQKIIEALISND